MSMMPILIVASVLGVKWGWEPVAGGGVEYIVRIEPETVEALRSGRDIFSDLPPQIQRVRSYRITVSNKPVPHEGELPPPDSVPPAGSNTAAQTVRVQPSGTAISARQPVDDDPATPPPATAEPFANPPPGEQPPPTFQPPAIPPAAENPNNPNNMRRDWPPRSDGGAGAPPSLAPPPGSNGITNLGPPETGPTDDISPSDAGPPNGVNQPNSAGQFGNAGPPSNFGQPNNFGQPSNAPRGPALQPPTGNWPNENQPRYGQRGGEAAAAAPANRPAGFGPPTTAQAPPSGEWYDPPNAGQSSRNGTQGRSQSSGQGGYGERDLFGRPIQGSPISTQAKHSNASLEQNLAAAEQRAVEQVESKPWLLVACLLGLFASVGLNVYLGMIAWDLYERYRATIDQLKTATEARVA